MSCNPINIGSIDNCSNYSGQQLFDYWCNNNCPLAYEKFLNNYIETDNGEKVTYLKYNKDNLATTQNYVNNLFNNYLKTNQITNNTASSSYYSFQNTLLSLCLNPSLPGVCDKFLTSYCKDYSRNQANGNQTITNFCGCYIDPDPNYISYTKNAACDPLCHRSLTVQISNPDTGELKTCDENICVIDNVSINTTNSTLKGKANIINICPYCPNGCLCIVSGQNINNTLSQVGIGENIEQFCGKNSVCIVEDANGNVISSGSCEKRDDLDLGLVSFPPISAIIIIAFVFILLLLIFLII